jgi:hypothetical protein
MPSGISGNTEVFPHKKGEVEKKKEERGKERR